MYSPTKLKQMQAKINLEEKKPSESEVNQDSNKKMTVYFGH